MRVCILPLITPIVLLACCLMVFSQQVGQQAVPASQGGHSEVRITVLSLEGGLLTFEGITFIVEVPDQIWVLVVDCGGESFANEVPCEALDEPLCP